MSDHKIKGRVFNKFNQHQNNQGFQIYSDILIDFMQIYITVFEKQVNKFPQTALDALKVKQHIDCNDDREQNVRNDIQNRIHQSRQTGYQLRNPVIIGLQDIDNIIGDAVYQ